MLKFKNRKEVFEHGRSVSNNIGDIAQNETNLRETDIILEFIKVDELINKCQEYKRVLIINLEQYF